MDVSVASELLRDIMARDPNPARPPDRQWFAAMVDSALGAAVGRRFPAGTGRDEVTDFALAVPRRYPGEPTGAPILIEGVIRAARGEHAIMDGVRDHESATVKLLTAYAIVRELALDERRYTELLDEIVAAIPPRSGPDGG